MTEAAQIRKRISMLQSDMQRNGVTMALFRSTDPHASEYVGDHFKVTEFFSGCTSDNVTLVVEADSARLWTDGRYFISAASELDGTGISLMKMGQRGVPLVREYLKGHLKNGDVLGFNGTCVEAERGLRYREIAKSVGANVESSYDPARSLWVGRPAIPANPVWLLSEELAGESFEMRLARVRGTMMTEGCAHHVISRLDDIMYLLNIRGGDVPCNPVALSYLLVGMKTVDLFIQDAEVTEDLSAYAKANRIKLHSYDSVFDYLRNYHFEGPVLADRRASSDAMWTVLDRGAEIVDRPNPTERMKAVKNPTEIANIKKYYLLDSVAVTQFIFNMKQKIGKEQITEYSAAMEMDNLRREIPGYLDLSFQTISAYNADAAMAHYQATEANCSIVTADGFLLVDSGGQYRGATTDVTRTIAMGPLTPEMKRDYTLTACANLRLLYTRFKKGTTGGQLDFLAREPLYRYGIDFDHGTGHGIGYILNVHEGPQRISRVARGREDVPFEAGMLTSDEPGVYREGQYGIRIETILLCVKDEENEFGTFLHFEPLTYAPLERDAIDTKYMTATDLGYYNRYQAEVERRIAPHLAEEVRAWLHEVTRPIVLS